MCSRSGRGWSPVSTSGRGWVPWVHSRGGAGSCMSMVREGLGTAFHSCGGAGLCVHSRGGVGSRMSIVREEPVCMSTVGEGPGPTCLQSGRSRSTCPRSGKDSVIPTDHEPGGSHSECQPGLWLASPWSVCGVCPWSALSLMVHT